MPMGGVSEWQQRCEVRVQGSFEGKSGAWCTDAGETCNVETALRPAHPFARIRFLWLVLISLSELNFWHFLEQ